MSGGHSDEALKEDGFIPRVNVSYNLSEDILLYVTYSEGFRPGGWNRGGGLTSVNPAFPTVSATYKTDDVANYEFGWKSWLLSNTLQFNGNVYFIEWTDMQVSRFDPVNVSILTFIENSADSEILGVEADVVWVATENLTLSAAFSYNDTELTDTQAEAVEIAPVGSELPLTPSVQGTVRARYAWLLGDYDASWQVAAQYAGSSYSSIVAEEREKQDSYSTVDASIAISKNNWSVEIFGQNLTDERADLFINTQDDIRRITTNRPRTYGLRVSYRY
jgi:outer membrane receptor protein involved in Fe transport